MINFTNNSFTFTLHSDSRLPKGTSKVVLVIPLLLPPSCRKGYPTSVQHNLRAFVSTSKGFNLRT